jgi:hypothetical protein
MASPEVAHLHISMARFIIFPAHHDLPLSQNYSLQGKHLWGKFFAPSYTHGSNAEVENLFRIPVSWFNFVTMMLLTPERGLIGPNVSYNLLFGTLWWSLTYQSKCSYLISLINVLLSRPLPASSLKLLMIIQNWMRQAKESQ